MFFAVLLPLVLDGFDQLIKLFLLCPLLSIDTATSELISPEKLWSRDSNPGRLGVERERYLCAMAAPPY